MSALPVDALRSSPNLQSALDRVRELGPSVLSPGAVNADAHNRFVTESMDALCAAGLFAPCVPQRFGGLGLTFQDYAHLASELAGYCASTAFSFNMHCCTQLMLGDLLEQLTLSREEQQICEASQRLHFGRIVEDGELYAQSFSEFGVGVSLGSAYRTTVSEQQDCYCIDGEKAFVSMAGHADRYGVLCTGPDGRICYLAVPARAEGVEVLSGPPLLGLRGTASHHVRFDGARVSADGVLLPSGVYEQIQRRAPYVYLSIAAPFLGMARRAFEECMGSARGRSASSSGRRIGLARLRVLMEQTEATWQHALATAITVDPAPAQRIRLAATQLTVMENSHEICSQALKLCGSRELASGSTLERLFRDSRVGAVLRPWPPERALELIAEWQHADDAPRTSERRALRGAR